MLLQNQAEETQEETQQERSWRRPSEQQTGQMFGNEEVDTAFNIVDTSDTLNNIDHIDAVDTRATTEEQEVAIGRSDTELDTALKRLSRQVTIYSWTACIAGLIAALAGSALFVGILISGIIQGIHHQPVFLHFSTSLLTFGVTGTGGSNQESNITFSGLLPLAIMIVCASVCMHSRRRRIALTHTVSQYDDVRAVGPLIESFIIANKTLRAEVAATLTRLIPRMTEADGLHLTRNQRLQLNLYMGRAHFNLMHDDNALSLAILRAYPVIGDGTELSFVRRIAKGQGKVGEDLEAQIAAQEYLAIVERRKAQMNERTSLLRGSSASEIGSDTLLRASETRSTTDPAELLRPDMKS